MLIVGYKLFIQCLQCSDECKLFCHYPINLHNLHRFCQIFVMVGCVDLVVALESIKYISRSRNSARMTKMLNTNFNAT